MRFQRAGWLIGTCVFFLLVDVLTKAYSYFYLPPLAWSTSIYPYGGIGVFQNFLGIDFSINYVMNKGAAWGVLASFQEYLLYARLLIIAGLLTYLFFGKMAYFKRFSLSLVTTGALGNVIDYFVYGHVVDMFYFVLWGYSFPVFNVADSIIFMGLCFVFFSSFLEKKRAGALPNSNLS